MRAPLAMALAPIGIGALGLVEREMYMVGAIVLFIAVVGLLTRLGDKLLARLR